MTPLIEIEPSPPQFIVQGMHLLRICSLVCEIGIRFVTLLTVLNMTPLIEIEPSPPQFIVQGMHLLRICSLVCEIGMILHTSAKICAWDTYVHFA